MSHVKSMQLGHVPDWLEFVNLIVRDPQLLQSLPSSFDTLQGLDQIPAKRQHLEVLEDLEVLYGDNQVC